MEDAKPYTVVIHGLGTVRVYATTRWHAIDKCYTDHRDSEADRSKYQCGPCVGGKQSPARSIINRF